MPKCELVLWAPGTLPHWLRPQLAPRQPVLPLGEERHVAVEALHCAVDAAACFILFPHPRSRSSEPLVFRQGKEIQTSIVAECGGV